MKFKEAVKTMPLIAILRGIRTEEIDEVASELLDIGFKILEVTLNSPNAFKSIEQLSKIGKNRAIVGAGTVTNAEQVGKVADAGGRLIISPNIDPLVVSEAKRRGLPIVAGVMTPSELFLALNLEVDAIKFFPAELLSAKAVRSILATMTQQIPTFPVGGINKTNMVEYLSVGVSGFGLGGSLYHPNKSVREIASDAKELLTVFEHEWKICTQNQ